MYSRVVVTHVIRSTKLLYTGLG